MATYATGIAVAIEAHGQPLTTKQICVFLQGHEEEIPIMRRSNSWRNGIRHTLSGHAAFTHKKNMSSLQPWSMIGDKLPRTTTTALAKFRKFKSTCPQEDVVSLIFFLLFPALLSIKDSKDHVTVQI